MNGTAPSETAAARLAAILDELDADAVEGCVLEAVVLHGTYTDGRGGYAGNLRRSLPPAVLRALIEERGELDEKLGAATRTVAAVAAQRDRLQVLLGAHERTTAQVRDVTETPTGPTQGVYRERAHLVALLAALYPSHIGYSDPAEPDWAVVVIESPAGQLSWHIAPGDMDLFGHVQATSRVCREWDGHSTDEKYRRLRELTATTEPFPLPPLPAPVWPAPGEAASAPADEIRRLRDAPGDALVGTWESNGAGDVRSPWIPAGEVEVWRRLAAGTPRPGRDGDTRPEATP